MRDIYRSPSILIVLIVLVTGISACELQRAQEASDAQTSMIGMSKEQLLACMGPPANSAAEGNTAVWTYNSGNGRTDSFGSAFGTGGWRWANVFGSSVSESRFCRVDVVMTGDRVTRVNYSGPTGGLLTKGEQCAFAVTNCVQQGPSFAPQVSVPMQQQRGVPSTAVPTLSSAPYSSQSAQSPLGKAADLGITGDTIDDTSVQAVFMMGDPHGALISTVDPGSPADKAGIRPGDVVKIFNRNRIQSIDDLTALVAKTAVGSRVTIGFNRSGDNLKTMVQF
jgi:hypothetical protein